MTNRLAAIKERVERATPGEWRMRPYPCDDWGYIRSPDNGVVAIARSGVLHSDSDLNEHRRNKTDPTQHNMEFIAHAHQDISYLLAEIERLENTLSAAKGYLTNALIDLQTNTKKKTTVDTLQGGIKMVDEAMRERAKATGGRDGYDSGNL